MKIKMTKFMCAFLCTAGLLNTVPMTAFAEEIIYPSNYNQYSELLEQYPDLYRVDDGSVFFINPDIHSMSQTLVVNSKQESEAISNTYGYIFKPESDGIYAVSTEYLAEQIVYSGDESSENSNHFHYFYPIITNYELTVKGGEISVENQFSRSYYSEEQVFIEKEHLIGEATACYDVVAADDEDIFDSYYYSWVNGVIPDTDIYENYISTFYNEYNTDSYFCVNLPYESDPSVVPRVEISDENIAVLMEQLGTSSSQTADDIMRFYRVMALAYGNVQIYAEGYSGEFSIRDGVFHYSNGKDGSYEYMNYTIFYIIVDDTYASITGYKYNDVCIDIEPGAEFTDTIYIPDSIDGYPVGAIEPYAFGVHEDSLSDTCYAEKLIIDSKYENFAIGENAFRNCSRLSEIKLPENLGTIGKEAFYRCDNLKEITVPKNVTEIGDNSLGYTEGRVYVTDGEHNFIDYPSMMPLNDFVIYGYNGTEAERYAEENDLIFEYIDATGDINGDGELTMNDNLSFQKYLTGQKTLFKAELLRADICTDGRVNCFDLAQMKTEIINKRHNTDYEITVDQHFDILDKTYDSDAVIRSKNEMIDFLDDYIARQDIISYSEKYDDEFFKDNILLLGSVFQSCGSEPAYYVRILGDSGNTLYIDYTEKGYSYAVEDVISRLIIQIPVPKNQFTYDNVVWFKDTLTEPQAN